MQCLWADILICEHITKPIQVLAYYYETTVEGIWLPSLCSLTMVHYISHQIHIEVTYVVPRKKMQSTWQGQKVATLEHEPGGEKIWNLASLEIYSGCWVQKRLTGRVPDFDRCSSRFNISCWSSHLSKADIPGSPPNLNMGCSPLQGHL